MSKPIKNPVSKPQAKPTGGNSLRKQRRKRMKEENAITQLVVRKQQAPVSFGSTISSALQPYAAKPFIARRCEFIMDINGSTNAYQQVGTLPVNPGLAITFPWLSTVANNFDMYQIKRLVFKYFNKTTTANKGEVIVAYDPKVTDAAPTASAQILNFDVRFSTDPWMDAQLAVPTSDLNRLPKYMIRNAVVSADYTNFDIGNIFIATTGNVDGTRVGQLYVDYEIHLFSPQVQSLGAPGATANSEFFLTASTPLPAGTTILPYTIPFTNPLGLVSVAGVFSGLLGTFSIYAQQTIGGTSFTSANLLLQKNGVTILAANYPALVGGFSTANVFALVSFVPSDTFDIAITMTVPVAMSAPTGTPPGANSLLIVTPA
jgi:hypothetical protein